MTRILQISDTHLSDVKPQFAPNWAPLREWIGAQRADLIVHTGDLTVDGAGGEADIEFCAGLLRSLPAPVLVVPGNHDVGDAGNLHQPVNAERLARWRRHFGHDWWSKDIAGWRLIGFDSMLVGSGSDEEQRQFDWLERTMRDAGDRRIAWFTHRPLFIDAPGEGDTGYWSIKPGPRAKFLALIERHGVALVATGHLHKWCDRTVAGCRYVWGPSSGFLVGPDNQPDLPGDKRLGAVVYQFDGAGLQATMADVPGLSRLWIDDFLQEVYPPLHAA